MASELAEQALSKARLRAWIRLYRLTRAAESELREFLRLRHGTTLPRFDVMAALDRRGDEPATMSELSRMLLVSNGNVTTVVDRLEEDGLVKRTVAPADRRTIYVKLTAKGVRRFARQAAEHEREVDRIFGRLGEKDLATLSELLKRTHGSGTS